MKPFAFGGVAVLAAMAVGGASTPAQHEAAGATPTFNRDVAPILFSQCLTCHRPGQVAPMSLLSYREARPWARAIKAKVTAREMPPWGADPRFGRFRNERGLTQEQIDTIVAWVDRGAPEGDGTPPTPPQFSDGGWSHPSGRPPDLSIDMPFEVELPAQGQWPWFVLVQPWPFQEDKFIEAVQVVPANTAAAHHLTAGWRKLRPGTKIGSGPAWPGGPVFSNVIVNADGTPFDSRLQAGGRVGEATSEDGGPDSAFLVIYAPPLGFQQFQPGVGKRIPKDSVLYWNLHYTFTGRPEKDRSRVGLWFSQGPVTTESVMKTGGGESLIAQRQAVVPETPSARQGCAGPCLPVIPPYEGNYAATGITPFREDVVIHTLWPHMHARGKNMTYLVTYPDGREEVLLHVPRFNFNWQLYYELAEPMKIPAGSTLRTFAHFDNSVKNRENPGPDKEVYWSEQSWDEMFTGFYEMSVERRDQ